MSNRSYRLVQPNDARSCVIFSSPHSGAEYSAKFLAETRLDALALRSSEDAFVDELFSSAPEHGAPLITAKVPRAFVDLNRAADELDPSIILGAKVSGVNPRIAAGLGVIPRVVSNSQVIRNGKMSLTEAKARVAEFHTPYHNRLSQLIKNHRVRFGMAILVDCHSMPKEALDAAPLVDRQAPDIVLGDRFGASADRWVSDMARNIFEDAGFKVARNAPFAGGYITKHYGHPSRGIHALQVEINRAVYMDESQVVRRDDFDEVKNALSTAISKIAALGAKPINIAAE